MKKNYGRDYKEHLKATGAGLKFMEVGNLEWIGDVIKRAKKKAGKCKTVEFEFNGIRVQVNAKTDIERLLRDYNIALCMKWTHIGPEPVNEYSTAIRRKYDKMIEAQWRR